MIVYDFNTLNALAKRNSWDYSFSDGRPYFMKNGQYATPTTKTSYSDKEMLAEIISEGSKEMKKLILTCWENNIKISGPCSGIKEFHDKPPYYLHFTFIGQIDLIASILENLKEIFTQTTANQNNPYYSHMMRENSNDEYRYDFSYILNGKELTKEEAEFIFSKINNVLEALLSKKSKTH